MSESMSEFIERVNYLQDRYEGHKYVDMVLMPLELLIRVKDELTAPSLFDATTTTVTDAGGLTR